MLRLRLKIRKVIQDSVSIIISAIRADTSSITSDSTIITSDNG